MYLVDEIYADDKHYLYIPAQLVLFSTKISLEHWHPQVDILDTILYSGDNIRLFNVIRGVRENVEEAAIHYSFCLVQLCRGIGIL